MEWGGGEWDVKIQSCAMYTYHKCARDYVNTPTHIHLEHISTSIHTYILTNTYTYTHIYTHKHIITHIHIYTHTHKHT